MSNAVPGGKRVKVQKSLELGASTIVRKAGDGGNLPPPRALAWAGNDRDILAGRSLRGTDAWPDFCKTLIETSDPSDRAHQVHATDTDASGREIIAGYDRLIPATELEEVDGARPGRQRRYPPCHMVGAPGAMISLDSMYDQAAIAAHRLEREGIPLGWGRALRSLGQDRLGVGDLIGLVGRDAAVAITAPNTFVRMSTRERDADRQTTEWLRDRGEV